MKGGMHATTFLGKKYCANLKWAWKDNGPKLMAFITSNNNEQ
jgi:hypothetical protein